MTGEGFPYLGRGYRLLLVDEAPVPVRLWRGRLELRRDCVDDAERHLIRWYMAAGKQWLAKRALPWAQRMEVNPGVLRVRALGYRWGSCSKEGTVNIHWATIQLPPDLIDYILVHEFGHVHQHDHGSNFWTIVERAMPDATARRTKLRKTGPYLWLP